MHNPSVRRLALQVARKYGIVKAAQILSIHRSTIWRWKKHGIDPAARLRHSRLYHLCERGGGRSWSTRCRRCWPAAGCLSGWSTAVASAHLWCTRRTCWRSRRTRSARGRRTRSGEEARGKQMWREPGQPPQGAAAVARYPEVRGLRFVPETRMYLDRDKSSALAIGRLRCMELLGRARPAPFCRSA
jgi:hypothetical protein